MRQLRALFLRFAGIFNRHMRDRELSAEMESHLQMHVADNIRSGLSPLDARRQALIQLGGLENTKESYRQRRGLPLLETLAQDLRYGTRTLGKNPGFAIIAVATLALGIGANTLIFSLVDGVLLKPLPFSHPERLAQLFEVSNHGSTTGPPSWADYQDWIARTRTFSGLVGYTAGSVNVQSADEPRRVRSMAVTANMFDVLGIKPALGRGFLPGEDSSGAACVTVLSDRLWRVQFGKDPGVVRGSIKLNGEDCSVIGIAPAGFEFPTGFDDGLWLPIRPTHEAMFTNRGTHFLRTIGRLKDGVGLKAAENELKNVMGQLSKAYPREDGGRSAQLTELQENVSGQYRSQLAVLFAAVGCVLLLACANVANMMLARASGRRHEIAIRSALGATRPRLLRQLLTESMLLALLGAASGVGIATLALSALHGLLATYLPSTGQLTIDGRVMAFALVSAMLITLLFGLAPALHAVKDSAANIREATLTASPQRLTQRFRAALIVFEVGMSFVLLVTAALLAQSLLKLHYQETGMRMDHVVTFKIAPSGVRYKDRDLSSALYSPLLDRLRALPEVKSAGAINALPLQSWGINGDFELPGHAKPADANWVTEYRVISPQFFSALGVTMLQGRDFNENDTLSTQRVIVVNDAFAKTYLGTTNVVGQQVAGFDEKPYTIVGVYRGYQQAGISARLDPEIDLVDSQIAPNSVWAQFSLQQSMSVVVRSATAPEGLLPSIRSAVHAVDPTLPVYDIQTMAEVRDHSLAGETLVLLLIGSFAALALVLALIGMYGVLSYYVAQRTREIGIRMALGAQRFGVLKIVLGQTVAMALGGIVLGLASSVGLTRVIASFLYGIQPTDAATMIAMSALLLTVALAACYVPARRAMNVNPIAALRHE